ncbi:PIN domain-containing protein [Brunnivagina elsteri]|uniref:PIN domain-containing protein n=1 Tax=Brunnivagina elsteri CCALA 953 TaxID=987040 RepID=A0A2A2TND9_9CYAN|nr:PIN domain-containing protein [Calothrix elsteri]PAX59638.1 hypothetical protein CK510_06140 [Calothrix elsteri CCALA 953]
MIGILVDADLILEALMNRNHLVGDISELLERVNPHIKMYITDIGWEKIYTYASRLQSTNVAQAVIDWLKDKITICTVDRDMLQFARSLPIQDFESAVEFACASFQELSAIVTHRDEDFINAPNKFWIWSVAELRLRSSLENQLQLTSQFTFPSTYSC